MHKNACQSEGVHNRSRIRRESRAESRAEGERKERKEPRFALWQSGESEERKEEEASFPVSSLGFQPVSRQPAECNLHSSGGGSRKGKQEASSAATWMDAGDL